MASASASRAASSRSRTSRSCSGRSAPSPSASSTAKRTSCSIKKPKSSSSFSPSHPRNNAGLGALGTPGERKREGTGRLEAPSPSSPLLIFLSPPLQPPMGSRSVAQWFNAVGITLIHAGTVYAFWRGGDIELVAMAVAFYVVRMFAITGVYHRYFAHRAYKTSRIFQLLLAMLGTSATQKGPLWWAAAHRVHHKYSDMPEDVHSPKQRGFWYAHIGWWMGRDHEKTQWKQIKDFAQYPELVFLEKGHLLGVFACMGLATAIRGFDGF